jgi:hypothetical protein
MLLLEIFYSGIIVIGVVVHSGSRDAKKMLGVNFEHCLAK